jgi:hypothetical protein
MNLYQAIRKASEQICAGSNIAVATTDDGWFVKVQRRDGGRGRNLGTVTHVWRPGHVRVRKAEWYGIAYRQGVEAAHAYAESLCNPK